MHTSKGVIVSHRRRIFGAALGAFLVGGLTVGLAMGVVGALPARDGGIALGALLVFPLFLKILFGFLFLAVVFRFIGGRRRWAGEGPPWGQEWRDHAMVTVIDDGPGIPASELGGVFERYRTGDTRQGSGIGLALSRELVEAHAGSISIESEEGVGTSVVVRLPITGAPPIGLA
jgi:hypothetical protein